jgi:hydrogenase maturation protease
MRTGFMKRIICIGNRYLPEDAAGYEVYRLLKKRDLPGNVDIIDGGLAGLDLLQYIEGAERVVFVDSTSGVGATGDIRLFKADEVAKSADGHFDHSSGLPYLLGVLPRVCDGAVPEIWVLGIEGVPDKETIRLASVQALETVLGQTAKEVYGE